MLLQTILPHYEVILPSSNEKIEIRPFTVKEEKLILMAAESKDTSEITKVVGRIVQSCVITPDIDIGKLPFFDIDYLFIAMRAKSIGEVVPIRFTCNVINEEKKVCGHIFEQGLDISKPTIIRNSNIVDSKIMFSDGKSGVKMRYPLYSEIKSIEKTNNPTDYKTELIYNCIEYIYTSDSMMKVRDINKQELKDFLEGLTERDYRKLEEFVASFPTFCIEFTRKCDKCGFEHNVRYTDFSDFFS